MIYIFPITMLIFLSAFCLVVIRAIFVDDANEQKRIMAISIVLVLMLFIFILFAYMSKHAAELLQI